MSDQDNKMIEYALNILDKESSKILEDELKSSHSDNAELRDIEQALTLLSKAEQPIFPTKNLRMRVMHSIQRETKFTGFVQRLCDFYDLEQETIEKHIAKLNNVLTELWQVNAFPGAHLLHFDGGPRIAKTADCGLVYVEPKHVIAPHRHLGDEWSLVLQGQMLEIDGPVYQEGDLIHRPAGSVHSIKSIGDEPLIFAAILFEGLEFIDD